MTALRVIKGSRGAVGCQRYVDVVLLRDVIERYAVTPPLVLRWMVRQPLVNIAGSFSINKVYLDLKSQGTAVAKDSLHALLDHLEYAFLLRSVGIAADSERRRRVNLRNVYPVDTGLIPIFDRSGKANLDHMLETVVFLELERRGAEVAYVRTTGGFEVDFHARYSDGRQELIQVCTTINDPETLAREIRALSDAADDFPRARCLLITLYKPAAVRLVPKVTLVAASEWLLGEMPSTNE